MTVQEIEENFREEIEMLEKQKVSKKGRLSSLSPFLDSRGIGSRVQIGAFEYSKKFPMLLDPKHPFTRLIIRCIHVHLLHSGPQVLLNNMREKCCPIGGRVLERSGARMCFMRKGGAIKI